MEMYPTVNFTGNKIKIAPWILDSFPISRGSVLDIFSGGCSVSYELKEKGFQVLSNDCLYANYVLSKALIENDYDKLNKNCFDIEPTEYELTQAYQNVNFLKSRLYFDYEIPELANLVAISYKLEGYQKYIYLSLLRRAMIRKLPYSRMNIKWEKIVELRDEDYSYQMYGRKRAYHNKSFTSHMLEGFEEYNNAIFAGKSKCKAYYQDAMDIANEIDDVDSVYLDPPYPSTLNDYQSFYGPFGNIFGYDYVERTDFRSRTVFLSNLTKLLNLLNKKTSYFVISINTQVNPPYAEIKELLSKYGKTEIFEKKHNYQLTGKEKKNSSKELLLVTKI